jgi:hypothetical protein
MIIREEDDEVEEGVPAAEQVGGWFFVSVLGA